MYESHLPDGFGADHERKDGFETPEKAYKSKYKLWIHDFERSIGEAADTLDKEGKELLIEMIPGKNLVVTDRWVPSTRRILSRV